ncbi:MAG: hypothetical protein ACFB8W_08890 [Elainellaceae cyanobacterium]
MKRPLLNQFRGAIAGAVLGLVRESTPLGWLERFPMDALDSVGPDDQAAARESLQPITQYSSASQAVRTIFFNLTHALIHHQNILAVVESSGPASPVRLTTPTDAALALLPVLLYFHDEPQQLPHRIGPLVEAIAPPSCLTSVLLIGHTFSQMLIYPVSAREMVPRLMAQLEDAAIANLEVTQLGQQLSQIQQWLDAPPGLAEMRAAWRSPSAAQPQANLADSTHSWLTMLVLYSFLCTPGDFSLSQQRSQQAVGVALGAGAAIASVQGLVGALVGAYLGDGGLPIAGHLAMAAAADSSFDVPLLATQLFAAWAGVHQPQMVPSARGLVQVGAIAAALPPSARAGGNSLLDDRP